MTIRRIDAGLGDGITGQDEWTRAKNTDANFQDVDNAASYLVGSNNNQVPRAQDVSAAYLSLFSTDAANCNLLPIGSRAYMPQAKLNTPSGGVAWVIYTEAANAAKTAILQTAIEYLKGNIFIRSSANSGATWTTWTPSATNKAIYTTTTASGANVAVDTNGVLMRSTSSERFKDNIRDFVLTDEVYDKVMNLQPIIYNSNTDSDDSDIDYYSFSAEKLGEIDPAFILYRKERKKLIAEGLNINAILALQHAISIKQNDKINQLEDAIKALQKANTE